MRISRPYLFIALLFLLLVIGWLLYRRQERRLFSSVWAFIPNNAVGVIESRQPLSELQQWQEQPPWQTLETLPYFQKLQGRLTTLQSAVPEVTSWLQNQPAIASVHVVSPDDFDYVFYLPLSGGNNRALFDKVLHHFARNRDYRTDSRNFGGFLIREITHLPSGTRFSYILHHEVVVGSYTSFLVEDVVRTLNEAETLQPNQWTKLRQAYSIQKDGPHLYVSAAAFPRFTQVFTAPLFDGKASGLAHITQPLQLTAKATPNGFLVTGTGAMTGEGEPETGYLATFEGQNAKPLGCLRLIPARTAVLQRWGLSAPVQWGEKLAQYWSQHSPQTIAARKSVAQRYHMPLDPFFQWLGDELVLIIPENADNPSERLLIAEMAQPTEALSFLARLTRAVDEAENIAPYQDYINRTLVRQIHLDEFPATLLGGPLKGFSQCFYASTGNYVIFGSSLSVLRQQLEDMRTGNVWQQVRPKAVAANQFDEKATFSYFVDVMRAWPLLLQATSSHWQQLLKNHEATLQNFDWLLLQSRTLADRSVSLQIQLQYSEDATQKELRNKFFVNYQATLDTSLYTAPMVVRSHVDQSREILVQDAAKRLYLLGANGKVLWRKWLEKPFTGEVYQVDYLKNRKLQYLFTTEQNLYLLDRNGNKVGNFPVRVPTPAVLQTAAFFDYAGNLDYRFLAQDLVGNLFLYDEEGHLLEGWNPLRLGYRLQGPVHHLRVQQRDYLVAVRLDGKIHVLNRLGKNYDGFPLDLSSIANPLFIEPGTDAQTTFLTALTDQGEVVRFNLRGEVLEKQQLYRPSKHTFFRLCIDNTRRRTWVIMRYDEQSTSILDRKGNLLFTKEAEPGQKLQAQYYDFGAGLQVIALTDQTGSQTRLFNLSGEVIGEKALVSGYPVSVVYSEHFNKLLIYAGAGRQVKLVSVKIR